MIKKLNAGEPVLLICKDDLQSKRLFDALSNDENFNKVCEKLTIIDGFTESSIEKQAIAMAGKGKRVTLSTAGILGRGVDIQSDNLLVLAAYVPTSADETQIKGRTGRIGKPGEYRMIPNKSDPDCPIDGNTNYIENEIIKIQSRQQRNQAFEREISTLYAEFLGEITEQFFNDFDLCKDENKIENLEKWQKFLDLMQKDWNQYRESLLTAVENKDETIFSALFKKFTLKWIKAAHFKISDSTDKNIQSKIRKSYKVISAQQQFFSPKFKNEPKVQRDYDPADEGQARIYSTLFPKTCAYLRGERKWFADYYAWREKRGYLFPDFTAACKGERNLFANLMATIKRLYAEWTKWFNEPRKPDQSDTNNNKSDFDP
jgi:hypothetical protein